MPIDTKPAEDPTKDEPKKPAVDPKLAMLLPTATFGVFAFLSIVVLVYALVAKPKPASAEAPAADQSSVKRP